MQKAPAAVGLEGPQHSGGSGVQPPTPTLSTPSVLGADAASASRRCVAACRGSGILLMAGREAGCSRQVAIHTHSPRRFPLSCRPLLPLQLWRGPGRGRHEELQPWHASAGLHGKVQEGAVLLAGQSLAGPSQAVCVVVVVVGWGGEGVYPLRTDHLKQRCLPQPMVQACLRHAPRLALRCRRSTRQCACPAFDRPCRGCLQMSAGSCQSLPRTPRSAGSATDLQPWEVPFADLAIHRPVGEGSFGQVGAQGRLLQPNKQASGPGGEARGGARAAFPAVA